MHEPCSNTSNALKGRKTVHKRMRTDRHKESSSFEWNRGQESRAELQLHYDSTQTTSYKKDLH